MSFRTREYYKDDEWDENGIDLAFWNGYEKPDFLIRLIIISMVCLDIFNMIFLITQEFTINKLIFLVILLVLFVLIIPHNSNLTILHLEYKRMDVFKYRVIPLIKPILTSAKSYYLVDFDKAEFSKSKLRLTPYYKIKIKFLNPKTTIVVSFRSDLPYKLHYAVYYRINKKCSDKITTTLDTLEKFYPYWDLKGFYQHPDYRYILLLSFLLAYFIFSLILPTLLT